MPMPMPAIPTTTAAALLSLLGVNTHINWNTQAWHQPAWPTIEADIAYLGVKYLRDAPPVPNWTLPEYLRLARQGVRFDVVPDALARQAPGSVAAVEGPNEINLYDKTFAGVQSMRDPGRFAQAIQPALYARVRADPALAGVPVYNLTIGNPTPALIAALGDMTGMADVANWHPYAGREAPSANLHKGAVQARQVVRGKPLVFTEGGYCGEVVGQWCSVTRAQQAAWTLDMLLDSASLGARLYLYELADNDPRTSPTDAENGFGLFDFAGHPYPVATALHDLAAIIADPREPARAPPLHATITGEAEALALAKSDGSAQLILWNEAGATSVTVTLPAHHARLTLYDPLRGTAPVAQMRNASSVHITAADHPVILTISGPGDGL
jgi:hypothetical protein